MSKKFKVVYFGNKFSSYRNSKSVMETLEPLFAEFCDIKTYSSRQGKGAKLADMISHFFSDGLRADKIIIDVYSTSAFYFAYIVGMLCRLFRKKYILFLHGGNLPARYEGSKGKVNTLFERAEKIIAPSNYLKTFFESKGFQVEYIPNILEIDFYPFKERNKITPTILALRGFGKPYNPLMTLKAINILKNEIADLKLLLLGNNDEYYYGQVVEFIKNNNLEMNVTIQSKVSRDKWIEMSMQYDIMVSNPVIDNTPVSIIEGMALGMCIISTNVGGVPYLVENGKEVLLVPDNDENALAESIEKLLNDSSLANKLSQNGRKTAETFDWIFVKEKWKKILKIEDEG